MEIGFGPEDVIVDVGAGRGEFGLYVRQQFPKHRHTYVPVDGSIDGVDLETWCPQLRADFYVAIESLEHLRDPRRLLENMKVRATKGVIITTPNGECTDVLGMDPTHKTALTPEMLMLWGLTVRPLMMFTETKLDTLVGRYRKWF